MARSVDTVTGNANSLFTTITNITVITGTHRPVGDDAAVTIGAVGVNANSLFTAQSSVVR